MPLRILTGAGVLCCGVVVIILESQINGSPHETPEKAARVGEDGKRQGGSRDSRPSSKKHHKEVFTNSETVRCDGQG